MNDIEKKFFKTFGIEPKELEYPDNFEYYPNPILICGGGRMNNYEKIKGSTLYEMALCLKDLISREPICRLCEYSTECFKGVPCYKMICQWLQTESEG